MIQCWLQKGDSFAGFGSYEEQQHHQRTRKSKSVRCQRPGALLIIQNANSVRLSKNATECCMNLVYSTFLKLLNSLIFSASKCVWSHQCTWGCQTGAKNWKNMVDTTLEFLRMQSHAISRRRVPCNISTSSETTRLILSVSFWFQCNTILWEAKNRGKTCCGDGFMFTCKKNVKHGTVHNFMFYGWQFPFHFLFSTSRPNHPPADAPPSRLLDPEMAASLGIHSNEQSWNMQLVMCCASLSISKTR